MTTVTKPVRVRIAPSPTGDPHVGTAYIALFNYCFAKKTNGSFILRIEDTDQTRSTKASEQGIFDALKWLGLNYDEGPDIGGAYGPYRQSERTDIYREHITTLINNGSAYYCFCTDEQLAEDKTGHAFMPYNRRCRDLDKAVASERAKTEPHVVRLAAPLTGKTTVKDRLRKYILIDNNKVDDQILMKSDGFPTYHFANVVDDHLMEITHVIRAEEWISSTPKHIMLYQAFGWEMPEFIHMPLLRNQDGTKISKRKNPVSINYYKDAGILPEALRNFLGLMGWSYSGTREKFNINEMIEKFDIDKVHLGGPVFDLRKLHDLNAKYTREVAGVPMKNVPPDPTVIGNSELLLQKLLAWKYSPDNMLKLIDLVKDRMTSLADFEPLTSFFFVDNLDLSKVKVPDLQESKTVDELTDIFTKYIELIDGLQNLNELEQKTREFCNDKILFKDFVSMVRLATTGREVSPPLFKCITLLGKDLTRSRLKNFLNKLRE